MAGDRCGDGPDRGRPTCAGGIRLRTGGARAGKWSSTADPTPVTSRASSGWKPDAPVSKRSTTDSTSARSERPSEELLARSEFFGGDVLVQSRIHMETLVGRPDRAEQVEHAVSAEQLVV